MNWTPRQLPAATDNGVSWVWWFVALHDNPAVLRILHIRWTAAVLFQPKLGGRVWAR